ncbi:MAG: hypothetical protein ACOCRX_00800 [Candidatus Woesearchaeota archaeon]
MKNCYNFKDVYEQSLYGVNIVMEYLYLLKNTVYVQDVQDIKEFQKKDIDLLRYVEEDTGEIVEEKIEIKMDTYYYRSQNIYAETISNANKNTKGCFLLTECDYLYYLFIPGYILYKIPMKIVKPWFLDNIDNFKESSITKTINDNNEILYGSKGRLIPRNIIEKVPDVEKISLLKYSKMRKIKDNAKLRIVN